MSIQTLCSTDEKGWRSYDINKLNERQCEAVAQICLGDADFERCKAITIGVGYSLAFVGAAILAVVVGHIAASFFTAFEAQLATYLWTSGLALFGLRNLFVSGLNSVNNHWNYANFLKQQADEAKVAKEGLNP